MCSATASFTTAGLTGVVGIVALARVDTWREIPLAAVPLFSLFCIGVERDPCSAGAEPQGPTATGLTLAFLLFAEVVWPIYAPVAVWIVELNAPASSHSMVRVHGVRQPVIWLPMVDHNARTLWGCNLRRPYRLCEPRSTEHSNSPDLAYLAATCLPMPPHGRPDRSLGAIVLVGSLAAAITVKGPVISTARRYIGELSMVQIQKSAPAS